MSKKPKNTQPTPLKPRLDFAGRRLDLQKQKLDTAKDRFRQRDKALFARVLDAKTKHDTARANVFGNELAEVRKIERVILTAALTIEQVIKRLRTIKTIDDAVPTLTTAIIALRSTRIRLTSIFPEAESELGEIGNMLSGVMVEAGQSSKAILNFDAVTLEAQLLINEAEKTAEQALKALPEIPTSRGE